MRTTLALIVSAALLVAACVDEGNDEAVRLSVAYLVAQQNTDGGFSGAPESPSDFSTSAWVALAFAAGGAPPASTQKLRGYLASQADAVAQDATGAFSAVGAVCMFVLAAEALGDPSSVYGTTDPRARLLAESENESLALNEKIFILGTIGKETTSASVIAIMDELKTGLDDPGHELLAKDAWFRSNALLALLRAGEDDDSTRMRQWAQSLLPFQVKDAGFAASPEYPPDASTTANVVAVFADVPFVYSHERAAGAEFIQGLQQPDGSVKFSHDGDFARTKTTAEAVLGWTGKGPFQR